MRSRTSHIIILSALFYGVGLVLHLYHVTLPYMILLTPFTIFLSAVIGLTPALYTSGGKNIHIWALSTYVITLLLEIVGVKTGIIFGTYLYGNTLGFPVFGVPLLIGINWTLIILGCVTVVQKMRIPLFFSSTITALLTVMFDWVMEPVAMALDYWNWEGGVIPLQNYLAWFGISWISAYAYLKKNSTHKSIIPSAIVAIQFLFFLGLRIFFV